MGHSKTVRDLKFDPNNSSTLISCSNDGQIIMWDIEREEKQRIISKQTGWIGTLAFSPDSSSLAFAGKDCKITIFNMEQFENIQDLDGHLSGVLKMSFSSDGKKLISSSYNGGILIWDVNTGEKIQELKNHQDSVYAVDFHPSHHNLISSCCIDGTICLWDIPEKGEIKVRGLPGFKFHQNIIKALDINKSRNILVSGSTDSMIYIWDLETGKKINEVSINESSVNSLIISKNGRWLFSASQDCNVKVFDIERDFSEVYTLKGHLGSVEALALQNNEKILASGGVDKSIILWDIIVGKKIQTLKGFSGCVTSLQFSPNKIILASAAGGTIPPSSNIRLKEINSIYLWNVRDGTMIRQLKEFHDYRINKIIFNSNGNYLTSCCVGGKIALWKRKDEEDKNQQNYELNQVAEMEDDVYASCLDFNSEKNVIITGCSNQKIKIWDLDLKLQEEVNSNLDIINLKFFDNAIYFASENKVQKWDYNELIKEMEYPNLEGHTNLINSVIFTPDYKQIISGGHDSNIFFWDVTKQKKTLSFQGNAKGIHALAISSTSKYLYSGGNDNSVIVWDLEVKKSKKNLIHNSSILSLAINPNNNILAVGLNSKMINLWNVNEDINDNERFTKIKELNSNNLAIKTMIFNELGNILISAGKGRLINLWSMDSVRKLKDIEHNLTQINALALSPNGKTIAFGGNDSKVFICNISIGEMAKELIGHDNVINCLKFSNEGKILLSGSSDRRVFIWDILTGQKLGELKMKRTVWSIALSPSLNNQYVAVGSSSSQVCLFQLQNLSATTTVMNYHKKKILNACFSPSGNLIASSSEDRSLVIWDIKGNMLFDLVGHMNDINCVQFSPDEKLLASASDDKTVKFWSPETGEFLFQFDGFFQNITCIRFFYTSTVKYLATGTKTIKIWDMESKNQLKQLVGSHKDDIKSLEFVANGHKIISCSLDSSAICWNIKKNKNSVLYKSQGGVGLNCLAKNPTKNLLAIASNNKLVILFDLNKNLVINELKGHERGVMSVNFNSTGRILASGSSDRTVILWAVGNGEIINVLKLHQNVVSSVLFSPVKNLLLTASWDKTLCLYDDQYQYYNIHLLYKAFLSFNNRTFNSFLKGIDVEQIKRAFFYHTFYPLDIPFINLICYLQDDKALNFYFQIAKYIDSKVIFSQDFFGKNALQLSLEYPELTKLLINFLFDNSKNIANSSIVTDEILIRLIDIDHPHLTRLIDTRLKPVINCPKMSKRMDNDEIRTCLFKTLSPQVDLYYEKELIDEITPNSAKSKVEILYVDIPQILETKNEFLSKIARLNSDHEIFSSQVIEFLILHKWNLYASNVFLKDGVTFFIFLIFYTLNFILMFTHRVENYELGISCETQLGSVPLNSFIFDFIVVGFLIMLITNEIEQMITFIKSKNFPNYLNNPWNWIEWAFIILSVTAMVLEFLNVFCIYNNLVYVRSLHGSSLFLVWLTMIGYLRFLEKFSSMIRMVLNVLFQTRFFAFILFYFAFAFTFVGKFKLNKFK